MPAVLPLLAVWGLVCAHVAGAWWAARRVTSLDQFLGGGQPLTFSGGIGVVLAAWITGNTLLTAPEATYRLGVLGALGYSFIGSVALLVFGWVACQARQAVPGWRTVGQLVRARLDAKNYWLFLALQGTYVLGVLTTPGVVGGGFLEQMFGLPYTLSVALIYGTAAVYTAVAGFEAVAALSLYQVAVILLLVLVVPPVVYMNVAIPAVYAGLVERAPAALNLSDPAGWLWITGGLGLALGEVLMDNTFWQQARAMRPNRVAASFALAGLGWGFVPLALSTLGFAALAAGLHPAAPSLLAPAVTARYAGQAGVWLLLVCVWVAIVSSVAANLNGLVAQIVIDFPRLWAPAGSGLRLARWLALGLGALALLISLGRPSSPLDVLIFLGVLNGAYVAPLTLVVTWRRLHRHAAFAAVLVGLMAGYWLYWAREPLVGVLGAVLASAAVAVVGSWAATPPWRRLPASPHPPQGR